MPLVFVHGVNNRRGEKDEEIQVFDNRVELLKQQFARALAAGSPGGLKVFAPYWGDLGVSFAKNLACLPQSGVQALAVGQPEMAPLIEATTATLDEDLLAEGGVENAPLLTLARKRTLRAAVDLLFAGASNAPVAGQLFNHDALDEVLPEAARFGLAAARYGDSHPKPDWLGAAGDDDDFLTLLLQHVQEESPAVDPAGEPQALGIGDSLKSFLQNAAGAVKSAVGTVAGAVGNVALEIATPGARAGFIRFSGFARPPASAFLGRFVGDALKYVEDREPIVARVLEDVDKAVARSKAGVGDDPLYLVGHSFGGIILYDVLSHFRPDLECDVFITVGSQVALFAELGRVADKAGLQAFTAAGDGLLKRPAAAKRWVNIFDSTDLVGFGTRGVFSGVWDRRFETDALPLASHVAYFETPRFFDRLAKRVKEAIEKGTDVDPELNA